MNQVWTVILMKARIAGHQIASVRHQSKLKVGVLTFAALALWFAALFLFDTGFGWLIYFGGQGGGEFVFGKALLRQSLNIFALSIFVLLVFSNTLVAFSTLYRSKEVVYLLQGPISYTDFFYARFIESVSFSSWSLAYLGSPMMVAYAWNTQANAVFYVAIVFFFLPFVVIPACLGSAITMLLVRFFPRMNTLTIAVMGVVAVLSFFAYIRTVMREARFSESTTMPAILQAMDRTQSPFLPSHWAAQGLRMAGDGNYTEALFWFGMLLSTALFVVFLAGRLADLIFYSGWSYLMGQDKQRIKPMDKGALAWLDRVLSPVREPYRALFHKDIKLFWRDPTQWSQFAIFFGIMAIYIANIRNTTRLYENEFWRGWIACLNVGAVTLIVATLTSRFVFPLISLEGRRIWILGLAPLTFRQLIWQKFWLSVSLTSAFTVGLALLSGYMLALQPLHYGLTVYSVLVANMGLSGMAVGFGALYPTFTEDNPARIVSGMGGTLNLLSSVAFVIFLVALQVLVLQWKVLGLFHTEQQFQWALAAAVVTITALGVLCTWLPMRLGLRNLNQMEL